MPDISSLTRAKPTEVTISCDGESLRLSFDANKVTPRWMDETMRRVEAQDMLSLSSALAAVMISWDVTSGGQAFPPTKENIALLSFPVVNSLFENVCKTAAPSDAEGNASPPSSGEPALETSEQGSPSSQNGSATSPLPTPSASLSQT